MVIGFSFFTVLQLGELLVAWLVFKCCRRRGDGAVEMTTAA